MSQKFLLSSAVILRSEPQYYMSYVAFDCRKVKTEFLEEKELKALEYIYGKSAEVTEIAGAARMNQHGCEKFLKRMTKLGYVRTGVDGLESRPPERVKVNPKLYEDFSVPFLSAPTSVDVFITSRCNLSCIHCFANGGKEEASEIPVEDLASIFDQLESMGVFEIRINGGEPLLHPQIGEILLTLKKKRLRKVIVTNGIMLNDRVAELLKESGTIPTVSLDGSTPEEHDLFRGLKGSFEQTIKALDILRKHRVEYGVNCCLHKNNLNKYGSIIDLAAGHGACKIAFLDLKPVGRMKNRRDWMPSYRQYEALEGNLLVARAEHKDIEVSLDVFMHCHPLSESIHEARKGYVSCQAGTARFTIDSQGLVYPCNLVISDPRWVMGDAKTEKLLDIWFSRKWAFFRGNVALNDLWKCRDCKSQKKCSDFYCRLLPYSTNGDPLGPHPRCL